jgi:hypothetical protein
MNRRLKWNRCYSCAVSYAVVQIGRHSGTLRAMPENSPANKIKPEDVAATAVADDRGKDLSAGTEVATDKTAKPVEHGGPAGLEPTRYGDWERKGRCIDF